MDFFFAKNFQGHEFVFLGQAHLIALGCLVLLNLALAGLKNASPRLKNTIAWVMAIVLWVNEIGWHVWKAAIGEWDIKTMLPLQVCSILIWLGGWMLVRKNYQIYEFMYFMGIGGALQALITPDVGIYGYPHYRFFQTFISHGLIVTAAIYMTTAYGFRPTWQSVKRVFIGSNLYILVVTAINWLIGSNYLFTMHKPETASLFDILPAWPWYILYVELIGLITFLLLYLPFILKDWREKAKNRAAK
jgi:hypothetical integral membrane protein (TIGR02206 family)